VFSAFFVTLIVLASVSGGNVAANGIMAFSFTIVREWAFGFPELILHPPVLEIKKDNTDLIGQRGRVVAPLRPCGEVIIEDTVITVVSEEGILIDKGAIVVITGRRNDRYCVRVAES
jgi:membrane-bound ClpP family serine protease